jgi:hypothetical protein
MSNSPRDLTVNSDNPQGLNVDLRVCFNQYLTLGANCIFTNGKQPAHTSWKQYEAKRITADEARILQREGAGASGVAIIAGVLGYRCIDVDACTNFKFIEYLLDLLELPIHYNWIVKTGGGYHIWYRSSGVAQGKSRIVTPIREELQQRACKQVEVRQTVNYALVPPSLHPSGIRYTFIHSNDLRTPPAILQTQQIENFIQSLTQLMPVKTVRHETTKTPHIIRNHSPGLKEKGLQKALNSYFNSALTGMTSDIQTAQEGTRNATLNIKASQAGALRTVLCETFDMSPDTTPSTIESMFVTAHLIAKSEESESQARKTFISGWNHGIDDYTAKNSQLEKIKRTDIYKSYQSL